MLRLNGVFAHQRPNGRESSPSGTFVSPLCYFPAGDFIQAGSVDMDSEPKQPKPEIMPPVPQTEPRRETPEIPPDKNAPERQQPTQGEK
jgi:hypothetical protein